MKYPTVIPNIIGNQEFLSASGLVFENLNPHDGSAICQVTSSNSEDIDRAVKEGLIAQKEWSTLPAVKRGRILFEICGLLQENKESLAEAMALETGKSISASLGEIGGAIDLGRFYAGEGQRLYGRTTVSGVEGKQIYHLKEPVGLAGLIISANTPVANIAWKFFPAAICGNAAVLKSSEDAPLTAYVFGKIIAQSSLPKGVLGIVHGNGPQAGSALVNHPDVAVISFTGSTEVGKQIAIDAGRRMAKVSLELGGKNALVVCDDADLDRAVKWILLSAFSNAGQRCAAASRVIIFESVYEDLKDRLVQSTSRLKLGTKDTDDLGPLIKGSQVDFISKEIAKAKTRGANVLIGGGKATDNGLENGFYFQPTILENLSFDDSLSQRELFGPVITLYKVKNLDEALDGANHSSYGLTSAIHTRNFENAIRFTRSVQAGLCNVNGPTYGSEPHLPFGGVKQSGNGSREPGTEAIDIYTNLKTVSYFL